MDKKFFLYAVLGIVLFALWNAWQIDYNKKTDNTVISKVALVSNTETDKSLATITEKDILPNKAPQNRIIKITTDVLNVSIDKLGGNIVSASLIKYPEELHSSNPITILSDNPDDFYVVQGGILSDKEKQDKQEIYTASKNSYNLKPGDDKLEVTLSSMNNGVVVNKKFIFMRQKYNVAIDYEIVNKTGSAWDGVFYNQIVRKNIATKSGMFHPNTYDGAAISSPETPYEKVSYANMSKSNLDRQANDGWVGMQQRYFLSALIPEKGVSYNYYTKANNDDQLYTIGFKRNKLNLAAGEKINLGTTLYVGPEISENLKPLANGLDHTVDYGWLWIISIALLWIMKKIHFVIGNWGWSIILLTILIKLVFYKLSEKSCLSMARMKELAPKIQALKERYGDDKQKLSQATMEIYKKEKVNPFGGCLPMLVQIPFFIALYYVLVGAVELRQAPFILWIHDLSIKDPYYILPILMGLAAFAQQKLSPPASPDPAQAKMMMLMPVMFTVFFLSFPAGLVLYWMTNNCLQVLQQWYINRKLEHCVAARKR